MSPQDEHRARAIIFKYSSLFYLPEKASTARQEEEFVRFDRLQKFPGFGWVCVSHCDLFSSKTWYIILAKEKASDLLYANNRAYLQWIQSC